MRQQLVHFLNRSFDFSDDREQSLARNTLGIRVQGGHARQCVGAAFSFLRDGFALYRNNCFRFSRIVIDEVLDVLNDCVALRDDEQRDHRVDPAVDRFLLLGQ